MRWSLRRGSRDADGRTHDASAAPVSGVPTAAPDAGWRSVPPPASSWSAQPPLTAAPLQPRTPLTAEPKRRAAARRLHPAPADGRPEPGRVTGLAQARRAPLTPVVPAGPPAPYVLDRPPLRHAPTRPLVEHVNLTEASDAFVGEPIAPPAAVPLPVPPPPPGPSAPPRPVRADPPVEAATEAGARFREALANLHNSGLPRYVSPTEAGARPPEPPAAAPTSRPEPPRPADAPPPLTHRRNSLAQSRRLGLGAPLRSDGDADADPEEGDPGPAGPVAGRPQPEPQRPPQLPSDPPPSAAPPTSAVADFPAPEPPAVTPPPAPAPVVVPIRPVADGTSRPQAATAPLVFRARPGGPLADRATRPLPQAVVTRAPAELTQALRSSHGVDVSDVPVHRDPAAGAEARERRARAFTRGGRVFLPEEAGALHSGPARGLLAHELVHVAQQRRLGSSLPGEETPEGQALEAEAQHAERMYSTDAFPEPELVHAPPPVSAGWVEDRITQHAFMTQPAGYPGVMTGQGGENLVNEVKYAATEVIKKAIEEGDLGGSGSGSGGAGGRNPNVPLGVGIGQAQNEGEFQAQMLAAINAQRLAARQSAYANFSDLDEADRDRIMARYREVANQNADAIAQSQMQVAVQHLAQQQHLAWTPERQFHVPDESPTNAPTSSSGSTPTPPGTPPSTTAGTTTPTAPSTTPTPRTPRTTTPPAPQPPPTGYDIGIGHAHTWEEFRDQVLIAVNVDRDANEHMSWESLSRADQQRIEHRWDELKAAQATTARNARIQAALDQSRRRTPTPTTPEPTAPPSEQATLAAGALAGAQVADARNAAEHTNDLETDSGITNTTSSGHPAISVDRIDMDDLTTRLYERLRSRLRMELLVDRERAGLLTDFR